MAAITSVQTAQVSMNADNLLVVSSTGQLLTVATSVNNIGVSPSNQCRVTVLGSIVSLTENGIFLTWNTQEPAARHTVTVAASGQVIGGAENAAIYLEGPQSAISNAGTVEGGAGLALVAGDFGIIDNVGTIVGLRYYGVTVNDSSAVSLSNAGTIGGPTGVQVIGGTGRFTNSGTIFATDPTKGAIEAGTSFSVIVRNSGELSSAGLAVNFGTGLDRLVNSGSIDGDVMLGAGNDLYRGRLGTLEGDLFGGDGDDTMVGGAASEAIFGGAGKDRIDGGDGDDVLRGAGSQDIFVFHRDDGHDRIGDFVNGSDRLDLGAIGFVNFAAVAARATDVAGGMLLDLSTLGGGSILLAGFAKAQFDFTDVILT